MELATTISWKVPNDGVKMKTFEQLSHYISDHVQPLRFLVQLFITTSCACVVSGWFAMAAKAGVIARAGLCRPLQVWRVCGDR